MAPSELDVMKARLVLAKADQMGSKTKGARKNAKNATTDKENLSSSKQKKEKAKKPAAIQ
jgi:hypothetical protein